MCTGQGCVLAGGGGAHGPRVRKQEVHTAGQGSRKYAWMWAALRVGETWRARLPTCM